MSLQPATRRSNQPLGGSSGDWRRRLLLHYVPLALASAVVLVLFMTLPPFDTDEYPPGNIFSGTFPQEEFPGVVVGGGGSQGGPIEHGPDQSGPAQHEGAQTGPMGDGGGEAGPMDPDEIMGSDSFFLGLNIRQFTVGSGYLALGLLGLTLLIGPANLLLRRRHPVSNYLARDVGTWTAVFSVVHVVYGLQVHGGGQITDWLDYFVVDGSPLTTSFGLGNWTGLAATVIVVGLLAISSNFALRKLKARTWKNLQRLNYALFALVIVHAFFYGALLRLESPFTVLLGLSVGAVFTGQAVGVWLWRRRYARMTATQPA